MRKMKQGKWFGMIAALLVAITLGACSSGVDNYVPDNPSTGVMSRATADEIFVLDMDSNGLAITGIRSARMALDWMLKSGDAVVDSRTAITVTVTQFKIPPYIDNIPVVKIGPGGLGTSAGGDGSDTDISTVVSVIKLPTTIQSLGANLFRNVSSPITLVVPPAVVQAIPKATILAAAGEKTARVDGGSLITPDTTPSFGRPNSGSFAEYILTAYEGNKAKLNGTWYTINEPSLQNLFAAIYEPNKPGTTDTADKATIPYDEAISVDALALFKITIGASSGDDKVELKGTDLPTAVGASATRLIVIDIGKPGADNSGLPTFYIPKEKADTLGAANVDGDYSHIRLRVNSGAELVILADNFDYIDIGQGNSCPEGNFKGGCVEVMAGGKLRDGAYEGFPLGSGAVILNRAGSYLSIGPEEDSPDAIKEGQNYTNWYAGYLIGPAGSDSRVEWNNNSGYLEVRAKQIATNAQLTVKKNMGLIYSVWFLDGATLTIESGKALMANERGVTDYNFYTVYNKTGLITINGSLDRRFLTADPQNDAWAASNSVTATSIDGSASGSVSEGYGATGIIGYLVTHP
jgi:hypothetical protein